MGLLGKAKELRDKATNAFQQTTAGQIVEAGRQAHEAGQLGEFAGALKELATETIKAKAQQVKDRFRPEQQ